MKILFISKYKWPHIGGVEKHVDQISKQLKKMGHEIDIISEEDIKPPHVKLFGLLYIWIWLLFNASRLILKADIVHIHDVFIWYLPFIILFPFKKVYVTFHGWEGKYPPTVWSKINKKVANYFCNGSIAVGRYIEKWYGINADYVIHGGINPTSLKRGARKLKNTIVWLGRQDEDTGIKEFKKWLVKNPKFEVTYVTNIKNPEKYLKTAEYCVPSGYLSYLEAKNNGCKIITFANNLLKVDYWKEIKLLKVIPTWDEVAKVYRKLWSV